MAQEKADPLHRGSPSGVAAPHYTPKEAFLEFGSTSIKFYLLNLAGEAAGQIEREVKVSWNLGYDVFQHSRISPRSVAHCVATLKNLQAQFPEVPFDTVTAVGTAALREAHNSAVFQRVLWEELGVKIHIIEGGIEAFLLETGFREAVEAYPTGLFDLGGGSLELVEYLNPYSTKKTSLPLGAIRLHCQLRHARDLFAYIAEGRRKVGETLRAHLLGQTPSYRELIGTGGTVRAIVDIAGKADFTLDDMRWILQGEIRGPTWDKLPPHRRKALLPGVLAVEGLFTVLGVERVAYKTASVNRGLMTLMKLIPSA